MKSNILENKRVIIFDLDGTLIDSVDMWNELDYRMLKEMVNKEVDKNILQKQREKITNNKNIGNVYKTYRQFLIDNYKIPYDLEYVTKRRKELTEEFIIKDIDYKKDADNVLKILKKKGYILVLATITSKNLINQYTNENENLKNKAKFDEIFDLILTTDDVKAKKPNPEVYLKVLEKLKVSSDECIALEDSIEGVSSAKNANIEVINIVDKYSKENQDKIDEISDYKFYSFSEFLKYISDN